jgi:hypothetical protein
MHLECGGDNYRFFGNAIQPEEGCANSTEPNKDLRARKRLTTEFTERIRWLSIKS